jgi:hypothetical protein
MKKQAQSVFPKLAAIGFVFFAVSGVNTLALARPKGVEFNRGDHDYSFDHGHHYFGSRYWWYNSYPYGYAYDDSDSAYDFRYWQDLAMKIQSELARLGYYHGEINGVIDSSSRQAIRAFQKAHELPGTGLIDAGLLRSLKSAVR